MSVTWSTDCTNETDFQGYELESGEAKFRDAVGNCLSLRDIHGLVDEFRGSWGTDPSAAHSFRNPYGGPPFSADDIHKIMELYNGRIPDVTDLTVIGVPQIMPWNDFANAMVRAADRADTLTISSSTSRSQGYPTGFELRGAESVSWGQVRWSPSAELVMQFQHTTKEGGACQIHVHDDELFTYYDIFFRFPFVPSNNWVLDSIMPILSEALYAHNVPHGRFKNFIKRWLEVDRP